MAAWILTDSGKKDFKGTHITYWYNVPARVALASLESGSVSYIKVSKLHFNCIGVHKRFVGRCRFRQMYFQE